MTEYERNISLPYTQQLDASALVVRSSPQLLIVEILGWKFSDERMLYLHMKNIIKYVANINHFETVLKIVRHFHKPNIHCVPNKKLSYCWETVRRESMPRIAEMDVEMTT